MPKLVKKGQIFRQINILGFWTNVSRLVGENDPLKQEVDEACANSPLLNNPMSLSDEDSIILTDSNGFDRTRSSSMAFLGDDEHGIPPIVNTEDPAFVAHLKNDIKLLNKLEKQYKNDPDNELLYQHIRVLKIKEQNALKGNGYGSAPGDKICGGGFEKMNDVILNVSPDRSDDPNFISNAQKSAKNLGLTNLLTDFVDVQMHNAEWAKEWNKAAPDPKSLRKIGQKLKDDMIRMDGHMKTFEHKCLEDMKKPEDQREMRNVFGKRDIDTGDIVYDFSKGAPDKPIRAVNGEHWDAQKELFLQELEGQLIGADLMKLQRDVKQGKSKVLSSMVQDMIDGCTAEYMDDFEKKKEKSKRAIAYDYIVRVQKLQELELEAKKGTDFFSKMVAEIAKDHLRTPEALKAMSDMENQAAAEKVNSITIEQENTLIAEIQKGITPPPEKPAPKKSSAEGSNPEPVVREKDFDTDKAETIDQLANMLAVQRISEAIKSYKVGMEDMAENGEGQALTDEEMQEMTNDMLSQENIKAFSDMIKGRDDFMRMTRDIKDWNSLDQLKRDALDGSGQRLKDRLYKASQQIIKEDTQRVRMEQQCEMQRQQRELAKELVGVDPILP